MWPDFAVAEAASYDVAAFLGPESMGEESASPEFANPESPKHELANHEENPREADAASNASDIHTPSAREGSPDAPAFIHHLPRRRPYETWSLGLGGVALIAIVAVSFLIGSRVGWLRSTAPQSTTAATDAATPGEAAGGKTDCVDGTGPGCTPGRVGVLAKSRRNISPAKASERSNKPVGSAKAKTGDSAAGSDDLVVYEKGKVVFRMKPEPATTIATDRTNQSEDTTLAKDAAGRDANAVVEAASTTKMASSKSVWLSPQDAEARLLNRIEPKVSGDAAMVRHSGTVVLEVQVAEDGTISSLRTISGDPMLASAATDAVRNWRYQPYRQGSQPSQFHTDVTFNFPAK
jgi:TonB family protein